MFEFGTVLGNSLNTSTERTPTSSRDLNASVNLSNGPPRPDNLYTPPTVRSNQVRTLSPSDSGTLPPPLPPRDVPFLQQPGLAALGKIDFILLFSIEFGLLHRLNKF